MRFQNCHFVFIKLKSHKKTPSLWPYKNYRKSVDMGYTDYWKIDKNLNNINFEKVIKE